MLYILQKRLSGQVLGRVVAHDLVVFSVFNGVKSCPCGALKLMLMRGLPFSCA